MKEILKAFLRKVIRNPKNYSCVDEFMASDEYKKLKAETIPKKNRCGSCNKMLPKGYKYCNVDCYNKKKLKL